MGKCRRRQARRRLGGGGGGGKTFGKEHGFGYGRNWLELQERGGVAAAALETTNMDGEISGLGEIRSQIRGQQRAPLDWRVLYETPGECWELVRP